MRRELKIKIFKALKTGPKTIAEIQSEIGKYSKKEISACIDVLIKDGWVERYGGMYRLKYVLDPPLKQPKRYMDWSYEHIQELQGGGTRPPKFMNPFVKYLPQLDQGDRGTCVGFSARYAAWLKQLELVDPKPSEEECSKATFDIPIKVWGQCTMLVDQLYEYAPSAQGLYYRSRIKENVTVPSGSYIRGAVRTWKDEGYNFEKDWNTPKTARCAPLQYPIADDAKLLELSKDHKLDGYAAITTWEGLKDAIYNYGCALVAIDLYENIEANGKQGVFPDPNGEVIGSHAMCAIGYDENYVYVLHSWRGGWSKIAGFSEKYYRKAYCEAYAPIDYEDVLVAKEEYGVITIRANVPCDIMFDEDQHKNTTNAKTSWLLGKPCHINVKPVIDRYVEHEYTVEVTLTKEKPNITLDFNFTEMRIEDRIRKFLEELLKKIFRFK